MICEVEVEPETGMVQILRLAAVDDVGAIVNPLTLEGQLHGSIAQGIGESLLEELVYSPDSGQLVTGSFMDYGMPRAHHIPDVVSEYALIPAHTNLLGVKGGSEAGNVGAPPAILNAIIDALSDWGIDDIALPATPQRIWRLIGEQRSTCIPAVPDAESALMPSIEEIVGRIDKHELVRLVLDICNIDSAGPIEAPVAQYVGKWLQTEGFKVRNVGLAGRPLQRARPVAGTGGGYSLLLNSHMDTAVRATDTWPRKDPRRRRPSQGLARGRRAGRRGRRQRQGADGRFSHRGKGDQELRREAQGRPAAVRGRCRDEPRAERRSAGRRWSRRWISERDFWPPMAGSRTMR